MENVDLDQVIKEFKNLDIPSSDIILWIPDLLQEIEFLRSENQKLMKIVDAADYYLEHDYFGNRYALVDAFKEWRGNENNKV